MRGILLIVMLISPFLFGVQITVIAAVLWLVSVIMGLARGCGDPRCPYCHGRGVSCTGE